LRRRRRAIGDDDEEDDPQNLQLVLRLRAAAITAAAWKWHMRWSGGARTWSGDEDAFAKTRKMENSSGKRMPSRSAGCPRQRKPRPVVDGKGQGGDG
jgi:hypothetical protein